MVSAVAVPIRHQGVIQRLLLLPLHLLLLSLAPAPTTTASAFSNLGKLLPAFMGRNRSNNSRNLTTRDKAGHHMFWPQRTQAEHDANKDEHEFEEDEEAGALTQVLDSIVKIHCTHSEPDYLIPWQKLHQSISTSSGFVIALPGGGSDGDEDGTYDPKRLRVMTNAHSVEYGSMVQVQRRGDQHKFQATVEVIANECDLAILNIMDDEDDENNEHYAATDFWDGLVPLTFGDLPALQQEVEVLGYPTGGDSLSITQGVVSRIEMQEYSQASCHLLAIQIDAAINAGNSGGPVVNDQLEVIGVAFQGLEGAENIGYVVPVTVVQHVLHSIERDDGYKGFCSLGIVTTPLENVAFRKSLGMMPKKGLKLSGIMVRQVVPTAPSKGIFLPNDVICQVDGIPVANDGKIPFRPGERVALASYIQTKFVGDTVKVQVLRQGKLMVLDVPVGVSKRLVHAHFDNRPPPYLIVAGLVFTPLSLPYLHASDAWESFVSDEMSYLLGKWHEFLKEPSDEVVILSQVLAHRENLGYDTLSDLHLQKLNGQKVRSLQHLKRLIDESSETFLRLEFAPNDQIVVLERASLSRVTKEVCDEHSIQRSCFLHQMKEEIQDEKEEATEVLAKDLEEKATINGASSAPLE